MITAIKKILRNLVWKRLDLVWPLSSGIQLSVANKSDWYIYNELFVDCDYDVPIAKVLEAKAASVHVMDLGANVGFFGLRWAHLACQAGFQGRSEIVFVEAAKDVSQILQERLQQIQDKHSVSCVHGLVGKKSGVAQLRRSASHFGNSLFGTEGGACDEVAYVDLDKLSANWPKIDLLKCDIEGSEQEFLTNYSELLCRTERLVIELHIQLVDIPRCEALIHQSGLIHGECLKERAEFKVMHYWRA